MTRRELSRLGGQGWELYDGGDAMLVVDPGREQTSEAAIDALVRDLASSTPSAMAAFSVLRCLSLGEYATIEAVAASRGVSVPSMVPFVHSRSYVVHQLERGSGHYGEDGNFRSVESGPESSEWNVFEVRRHSAAFPSRFAVRDGARVLMLGVGRDGLFTIEGPHGHRVPVDWSFVGGGTFLGKGMAPVAAGELFLQEVLQIAIEAKDDALRSFVTDCVAILPAIEAAEDQAPGTRISRSAPTEAECRAVEILASAQVPDGIPTLAAALGEDDVVSAVQTGGFVRKLLGDLRVRIDQDEEEGYEDFAYVDLLDEVTMGPVGTLPMFQETAFRNQAETWLTPAMGQGFSIEDAFVVMEGKQGPVIEALLERMAGEDTLHMPGVSMGGYSTGPMISLQSGEHRAVVFEDFMGRYAYVCSIEGLGARMAPSAPRP